MKNFLKTRSKIVINFANSKRLLDVSVGLSLSLSLSLSLCFFFLCSPTPFYLIPSPSSGIVRLVRWNITRVNVISDGKLRASTKNRHFADVAPFIIKADPLSLSLPTVTHPVRFVFLFLTCIHKHTCQ